MAGPDPFFEMLMVGGSLLSGFIPGFHTALGHLTIPLMFLGA